jgi:hypothetical protein
MTMFVTKVTRATWARKHFIYDALVSQHKYVWPS